MMTAISYEIDGFPLLLPQETQLPGIKRDLPHYGTNVGRLAQTIASKYAGSSILDVGANVGDTLAAIRRYVPAPVLCIEGYPGYLELLAENVRSFRDVEIEPSFVGGEGAGGSVKATMVVEKGTGRLALDVGSNTVATRSLGEILQAHPTFLNAKLLKIDTDGWDCYILQRNLETLKRLRPVVFFEYDPYFFTGQMADGVTIFETLRAAGYHDVLFWENTGDFFLHTTLDRHDQLMDLHEAVTGRGKTRYWDIAAFPREDSELAQRQRDVELAFFRAARSTAASD